MKHLFTIGLTVLLSIPSFARIYTVNNQIAANEPSNYIYKTFTDAHNNASNGDSIYVMGANETYGSVIISKKLTVYGPGYLHSENGGTQATRLMAMFRIVTLAAGSNGTSIFGITLGENSSYGIELGSNVRDILISHCLFQHGTSLSTKPNNINIAVTKCLFSNSSYNWISYNTSYAAPSNLIFTNNVVYGPFTIQAGTTGRIVNNTFINNNFTINAGASMEIYNNILLGTDITKVLLPLLNDHVAYNMSTMNVFGTANGNQSMVSESSIFIGTGSLDGKWQIKPNGPADNKGMNGDDIGAYGGLSPYVLSGVAPLPTIYQLTTTGIGNASTGLNITIKVKAN